MGTKNKYLWIVPIVVIGLVFAGCPKECVSPVRSYQAEHTIENIKDKYEVGDTIWFFSEIDCKSMFNYFTNEYDVFCDQNFSFPLGCVYFEFEDKNKFSEGAIKNFDFISIHGRIYNDQSIPAPETVNQAEYEKSGNSYRLRFGIVCKEKGTYYIRLRPGGAFGKDHCDRASLDNIITNPIREHQEWYISYRHPQEVTEYELRNLYCFKVEE